MQVQSLKHSRDGDPTERFAKRQAIESVLPTGWHDMTPDILRIIRGYLHESDLMHCSLVCSHWCKVFHDKRTIVPMIKSNTLFPRHLYHLLLSKNFYDPKYRNPEFGLRFELSFNNTTEEDYILLAEILQRYSWLPSLELVDLDLERLNQISSIFTQVTALNSLTLHFIATEPELFPPLPSMSHLKNLAIQCVWDVLIISPASLQNLTHLRELELDSPVVEISDPVLFPSLPNLRTLLIHGEFIIPSLFFDKMPQLELLCLNDSKIQTNDTGLSKLSRLTTFKADWKGQGLDRVINNLPTSLRHLHVLNHKFETPQLYANLPVWSHLEQLSLIECSFMFSATLSNLLARCSRLQDLALTTWNTPKIVFKDLDRLEQLRKVNIADISPLLPSLIAKKRLRFLERLLQNEPSSLSPTLLQYRYREGCEVALKEGYVEVVDMLLRYNRFPLNAVLGKHEHKLARGETPLLFVLRCWASGKYPQLIENYSAIVTLLLENGANVMVRTAAGKSVYDFARVIGDPALFKKLEQAQAQQISRSKY